MAAICCGRVGSILFAHVRPRRIIVRRYGGHASGEDLESDDNGHVRVGPQDPLRSLHLSDEVTGVRGRRSLLDWLGRGTDPLDVSIICRCPPHVKQCRGPCFYQFGWRRSDGPMPFQWRTMLTSYPRVTEDSYQIARRCRHGTPNVGWLTFASSSASPLCRMLPCLPRSSRRGAAPSLRPRLVRGLLRAPAAALGGTSTTRWWPVPVAVAALMLVTSPSSPATHSAITPAPPYCIPWCSSPRSYARWVRGALYATTKTVFELIDWQWRWASVKVASLKPILSVVRKAHLDAGFYDQCEE